MQFCFCLYICLELVVKHLLNNVTYYKHFWQETKFWTRFVLVQVTSDREIRLKIHPLFPCWKMPFNLSGLPDCSGRVSSDLDGLDGPPLRPQQGHPGSSGVSVKTFPPSPTLQQNKLRLFVPKSHFRPSLKFEGMPSVKCSTRVSQYYFRLKKFLMNKHASLFCWGFTKKVYKPWYQNSCYLDATLFAMFSFTRLVNFHNF